MSKTINNPFSNVLSPSSVKPQYNDFLNNIFSNKQHKSYRLREITDKRVNYIETKYNTAFIKNDPLAEMKLNEETEKITNEKF